MAFIRKRFLGRLLGSKKSLTCGRHLGNIGSPRLRFLPFKYVPGQAWTEAQDLLYNKSNKSEEIEK